MATFIVLGNFTDQGIGGVKDTVHRADAVENLADKMGCRIVSIHWTLGGYDMIATVEAPNDEIMAALMSP